MGFSFGLMWHDMIQSFSQNKQPNYVLKYGNITAVCILDNGSKIRYIYIIDLQEGNTTHFDTNTLMFKPGDFVIVKVLPENNKVIELCEVEGSNASGYLRR